MPATRPRLTVVEGGPRPAAPWPAALELAALGTGLTLVAAWLARVSSWFHALGAFQMLFALAFAFYALALLRLPRYAELPRVGLVVVAVAFAARIALVTTPPSLSGDIHRYLWEGRVVVAGGNPWRTPPGDPALAALRDHDVFPRINHPHLASIYPPVAVGGFALVALVAPTVVAIKSWVVLHDLVLVLLLLAWCRARGTSPALALAYAWNPLVLVEYAGNGHNDPTAIVWLVAALMLAERRPTASALCLVAGALTKLVPLVALPFLLARWPWRARITSLVLLAAGLAVFWAETRGTHSGLAAFWSTWRNNELVFHLVERALGSFTAARAVALAVLSLVAVWALAARWRPAEATRLVLRTGIVVGPVVHPWYLGWTMALEPLGPSVPWIALSLTAVLSYGVLATPAEGRDFHLPLAWRWVEYGAPVAVAVTRAVVARTRRRDR